MSNELKDREIILQQVQEYYEKHLQHVEKGQRISYAGRVFDQEEMVNLVDSALDFWLTSGRYCSEFEQALSEFLHIKYVHLVNSGSSANLLAFMVLTSPLLEDRRIQRGDEVITVAAGFPTTVTPIIQYGAIPVFVDISIPQYNIDVNRLEAALSEKTKAVMVAHTLGNPFDIQKIKDFCDQNKLWLIEDNCDALGSRYTYHDKLYHTGTLGDIGTSSFYPPHHITTGEGGAIYTNHVILNKIICSMRDWGRDCVCPSGMDNLCKHRFDGQYGELPQGYDHKYVYSHFGYNLKMTEMQAAIGCAQMKKLPEFIKSRNMNFQYLSHSLKGLSNYLILPQALPNSEPSWFGFMLTCKEGHSRDSIVNYLEDRQIQTRMLFAGNIIKHPCFDEMRRTSSGYRVIGNLEHTDYVLKHSFWIGLYPGMEKKDLDYMVQCLYAYFKNH